MVILDNVKSYGSYLLHVLIRLWLLTKEFLGYPVDQSKHSPCIPERHTNDAEPDSHIKKRSKDVEANCWPLTSEVNIPPKQEPEQNTLVIYQTAPAKLTGFDTCNNSVLPLHSAHSEAKSKIEDSSNVRLDSPANPTFYQPISTETRKLDGLMTSVLESALKQHQELENATSSRLKFVKGLNYTENSKFRFPTILSVLRRGSAKSQRTIKGDTRTQTTLDAAVLPCSISPLQDTAGSVAHTSTTPTQIHPFTLQMSIPHCPPLSPFPASSSSTSTSSSDTITNGSYKGLSTAVEDIPLHLIDLPSWRWDPDRASFVFGSLARGTRDPEVPSNSLETLCVVAEGASTSSLNGAIEDQAQQVPFESMIIEMGLVPTSATSTFRSSEGGHKGSGNTSSTRTLNQS